MIFDDFQPESPEPRRSEPEEGTRRRRRRRRRSESSSRGSGRRGTGDAESRRSPRPEEDWSAPREQGHLVWLWVLGLLIVAALGLGWYWHQQTAAPVPFTGEAPSKRVMPYIDPVLAPLETGVAPFGEDALQELGSELRAERERIGLDGKDIFATAGALVMILEEALADRARHIDRLVRTGAVVAGMPLVTAPAWGENERRHHQLAVAVSWQRNSGVYRDRIEELWARLLQFERGRFRGGSAPAAMLPHEEDPRP